MAADLIDYTPAIKDSALKLAKRCRMGPYFVPPSPADGKGKSGPAEYDCSWYAPGASGGVNIDGGTAADPETGMIYVGGQSGMGTSEVRHDPCSEIPNTQPHNICAKPGALPAPPGYNAEGAASGGGGGFGAGRTQVPTAIGGVSIFKVKELGGITAYDLSTGDKNWWQPNGGIWRDPVPTNDPMFAGVTLPKTPNNTSQPQVITTKTLLINGTGRGGGGGGGRGGARAGGAAGGRGAAGPPPQLYAFDKASGKLVGAVQIPSATSAVPMTFMHQGKQYIVFATGAGEATKLVALVLPGK